MYNYPNKIFAENPHQTGQKMSNLQMTIAALLSTGMSVSMAKRVYLRLQQIVDESPQLNRYDILLKLAQKLAIVL